MNFKYCRHKRKICHSDGIQDYLGDNCTVQRAWKWPKQQLQASNFEQKDLMYPPNMNEIV